MNEADTCRKRVRPKLEAAGWDDPPHAYNEQTWFTDGRIIVAGGRVRRGKQKQSDFLLRYTRDVTLAVVEAKSCERPVADGLQQAKDYADVLGLKFAYATNGIRRDGEVAGIGERTTDAAVCGVRRKCGE